MTSNPISWLSRHKRVLTAVSILMLIAAWWAFRPEKLWINQRVNEPAPFDTRGEPEPIFSGTFDGKTLGRLTVFKKPSGEEYLRLSDVKAPDDAGAHLELAKSSEVSRARDAGTAKLDGIDLGPLKTNQDDQIYDLPTAADLTTYSVVVIYNKGIGAIFASAKLEPF
jgi:Electron transfer DM13